MKVGDTFKVEFNLNEEIYNLFLQTFRDKNPLHTDITFAKKKGFENCVMHGNILNGFISYFVGECLPIKNIVIQSQEIQFHQPVYVNTVLNFEAKIEAFHESVSTYNFKFSFLNEDAKKVAKGKIQIGILA